MELTRREQPSATPLRVFYFSSFFRKVKIVKCKFPYQTRDAIERLYYKEVLTDFPLYKDFWEEFIGVRVEPSGVALRPYKLNLPAGLEPQRSLIEEIYEHICMIHYGCFCHLASAMHELESVINSKSEQDPQQRHFKHWQAFEASYLHLGAAWQEIKLLWEYICIKLMKLRLVSSKSTMHDDANIIWDYFEGLQTSTIHQKLNDMDAEIIEFRNDIAHFARRVNRLNGNGFEIPKVFQKNVSWTIQSGSLNWITTEDKLESDIHTCEQIFDLTHKHLIAELHSTLNHHQITIDYGSGKIDKVCPKCYWWMEQMSNFTQLGSSSVPSMPQTVASGSLVSVGSSTITHGANNSGLVPTTTSIPKRWQCQNPECKSVVDSPPIIL